MAEEPIPPVDETQPVAVVPVIVRGVIDPRGGRPTEYRPEFCQEAADLCLNGATDFEVAQALDVDVRTLYRWKAKYPEFRQALQIAKDAADERVEASLYHRAVGYSHPSLKIMQNNGVPVIVPYIEHLPPDVGAVTLWLINRRKDRWKARQSHEHSGPDGTPIRHAEVDELSDADLEAIARAGSAAPAEPKAGSD